MGFAELLTSIAALGLVALASREIGGQFRRVGLPFISGFLLTGVLAGPDVLALLSRSTVERLEFIDHVAIAFIGFAAGAELYLKDFRDRIRPILWVTAGASLVTLPLVALAFSRLSGTVPSISGGAPGTVLAAALLAGSILMAISPSSAIAIIKDLRAWGPFTRLSLGVTVVMDAVVIVMFTISAEVAGQILEGTSGGAATIVLMLLELIVALFLGRAIAWLLDVILGTFNHRLASMIVLFLGWAVFSMADWIGYLSQEIVGFEILLEPLLICMAAGLFVTNATGRRNDFHGLLDRVSPPVLLVFFTLAGAAMSLEVLASTWGIALVIFMVRLFALMAGAFLGGWISGEPVRESRLLWMSFITQAGVGLGLAKEVANNYPGWGQDLATIIIAVIVLNQLVGPPVYRWVLKLVGEAHPRADAAGFDGVRDTIIFGQEGQAMALALQLHENGWNVKLAALEGTLFDDPGKRGLEIETVPEISAEALEQLAAGRAESIVSLLDDEANFKICELAYEHYGTANLVVRAQHLSNHDRFHELGVIVVDPSTAMVGLLDHLVRSPRSTSLLLGLVEGRDVAEVQVGNPNLDGRELRDLVLPEDALILSLRRGRNTFITHGATRLRLNDWVTVLGSHGSLDEVAVRFAGEARDRT